MKPKPFPGNGRGLSVEYMRMREGPSYFVILYRNSSKIVSAADPKDVWRCLGNAKYTPTAQALKEWAVEMVNSSLPKPEPVPDTSFASDVEEPNDNTKMIT